MHAAIFKPFYVYGKSCEAEFTLFAMADIEYFGSSSHLGRETLTRKIEQC